MTAQGWDADGNLPPAAADAGTAAERAITEFAINGVAHLADIIPQSATAAMREVWPDVREAFDSRFGPDHMPATADGSYSGKGPYRHQICPLPLAPPFLGAWVEHPAVVAFLARRAGRGLLLLGLGVQRAVPGLRLPALAP